MLCMAVWCSAAEPWDVLRVYAIEPATFDYVFTSVTSRSADQPVLAFNHRSGRTQFRTVGATLDGYTITAYEPRTTQVFNASIKSYQTRECGRVTLQAPDGTTRVLEQGQRLPESGWAAWLVAADSGRGWYVQRNDAVPFAGTNVIVAGVSSNTVCIVVAGATRALPWLSAEEQQALIALVARQREAQRRVAEQAREQAESEHTAEEEARRAAVARAEARMALTPQYESRAAIGTVYRFPAEFQVVPGLINASTGRFITPTVVVPTRFETRSTGIEINAR